MDIFEIEKRGMFSPPDGSYPQILPSSWKNTPDEEIRTDLPQLTNEELNAIGWKGPIQMPPLPETSFYTHSYEWNTETREFDVTEFDESEKKSRVDYQKFWNTLLLTSAYQTIKNLSMSSLAVNTLVTEFIALLTDAKLKNINEEKIQESINNIVNSIPFSETELNEIQMCFASSGMSAIYSINIP